VMLGTTDDQYFWHPCTFATKLTFTHLNVCNLPTTLYISYFDFPYLFSRSTAVSLTICLFVPNRLFFGCG
jgi:hypothetical protein